MRWHILGIDISVLRSGCELDAKYSSVDNVVFYCNILVTYFLFKVVHQISEHVNCYLRFSLSGTLTMYTGAYIYLFRSHLFYIFFYSETVGTLGWLQNVCNAWQARSMQYRKLMSSANACSTMNISVNILFDLAGHRHKKRQIHASTKNILVYRILRYGFIFYKSRYPPPFCIILFFKYPTGFVSHLHD